MLLYINVDKKLLEKKDITLQTKVAIALHKMKYNPTKIFLSSLGISRVTYWRASKFKKETYGKGFLKVDTLLIWIAGLEPAILYAQILEYTNMINGAFPGEKTLSKNLGVSQKSIGRYKQILLKYKILQWFLRRTSKGNLSCLYKPCFKMSIGLFQNVDRFVSKCLSVCFKMSLDKELYKEYYKEYYKTVSLKTKRTKNFETNFLKDSVKKIPKNILTKNLKGDAVKLEDLIKQDMDQKIIDKRKAVIKNSLTISKVIEFWRLCLTSYGYKQYHSLTGQERGLMKSLLKGVNEESKINLNEFLEFCIANWPDLNKRVSINKNRLRMKPVPTFQEIYFMKEELLPLFGNNFKEQVKDTGKIIYRKIEDVPKSHSQYVKIVDIISKGRTVTQF